MSERITIQAGDVGRLEDVLHPKDPLMTSPRETARQIAEQEQAVNYALALMRSRLSVEAPVNAAIIERHIRHVASLTADLARQEALVTILAEGQTRLRADLAQAQQELKVTDTLLTARQELLDAIPPCQTHGSCVPHALNWITDVQQQLAAAEQARAELVAEIVTVANGDRLHEDADNNLHIIANAMARANEGDTFKRLSMALTKGNAATWDEVFHAAESLEQARDEARKENRTWTAPSSVSSAASVTGKDSSPGTNHTVPPADTPLRQAIRRAFDSPTLANLDALAEAAARTALLEAAAT